jgi:signal transduction histidine kinase
VRRVPAFLTDKPAALLAVGICASVALLSWFGFRAVVEWRNTSVLLADRRSSEAADFLVLGLRRDMSGVQEFVLDLPHWEEFTSERPNALSNAVANGFARYPYPESFFAWNEGTGDDAAAMVFFNRQDRRPPWASRKTEASLFPVVIEREPDTSSRILGLILRDAAAGRHLSAFEETLDGVTYQIIAQLTYRDAFREHLSQIVGFTVNLPWVRKHYFSDLTREVLGVDPGSASGLTLSVSDSAGQVVAGSNLSEADTLTHRRQFPLLFFDPDLQVYSSRHFTGETWTVAVSASNDPSLARAIAVANRMLLIGAGSALALAAGLILTVRADREGTKLSRIRSDFVSTVTHELKMPIATITAAAETLSKSRLTGMSFQACGRIILSEARRLSHLVENLLAYSRVADVADIYGFEPLQIGVIFNDIQQNFEAHLDQDGFELEMHIPAGAPRVRGDRLALRLLFNNLVDNAVKYSGTARAVRLNAEWDSRDVRITVIDSGVGIPEDEIHLVTRKFYRGAGTSARGSGLGLAIASRIAEDHGGTLQICSVVGEGTTVEVTLPTHDS